MLITNLVSQSGKNCFQTDKLQKYTTFLEIFLKFEFFSLHDLFLFIYSETRFVIGIKKWISCREGSQTHCITLKWSPKKILQSTAISQLSLPHECEGWPTFARFGSSIWFFSFNLSLALFQRKQYSHHILDTLYSKQSVVNLKKNIRSYRVKMNCSEIHVFATSQMFLSENDCQYHTEHRCTWGGYTSPFLKWSEVSDPPTS